VFKSGFKFGEELKTIDVSTVQSTFHDQETEDSTDEVGLPHTWATEKKEAAIAFLAPFLKSEQPFLYCLLAVVSNLKVFHGFSVIAGWEMACIVSLNAF
jgi:hypothetical protein